MGADAERGLLNQDHHISDELCTFFKLFFSRPIFLLFNQEIFFVNNLIKCEN